MSHISINRAHGATIEEATASVEKIAEKMSQRFGVECQWEDNVMRFGRPGVSGEICVDEENVEVNAKLGMMFLPMKSMITQEIENQLDKLFG